MTEAQQIELTKEDVAYPKTLYNIPQPPPVLYVKGDLSILSCPAVSIIGSRKATSYGLFCAQHFASLTASHGLCVISGGAIGCDQAAHQGALDAGGQTVVVLGCGADVVYPKRAYRLFERILDEGGALVSELPWGTQPMPWAFRKRNRIIAGLGLMLLVTEAAVPSGTFGTADDALEQGKDVFVVPGSILSPESRGSNRLMYQGATPVIDDESYLMALCSLQMTTPGNEERTSEIGNEQYAEQIRWCEDLLGNAILRELRADAVGLDKLSLRTGLSPAIVAQRLVKAESLGILVRYRDGRVGISSQYAKLFL